MVLNIVLQLAQINNGDEQGNGGGGNAAAANQYGRECALQRATRPAPGTSGGRASGLTASRLGDLGPPRRPRRQVCADALGRAPLEWHRTGPGRQPRRLRLFAARHGRCPHALDGPRAAVRARGTPASRPRHARAMPVFTHAHGAQCPYADVAACVVACIPCDLPVCARAPCFSKFKPAAPDTLIQQMPTRVATAEDAGTPRPGGCAHACMCRRPC